MLKNERSVNLRWKIIYRIGSGGQGTDPVKRVVVVIREHFTVAWNITVQLASSFTRLNSAASLQTKNKIISSLVKFSHVKLETSWTVTLPPTVSVLCRHRWCCHSWGTTFCSIAPTTRRWSNKISIWQKLNWIKKHLFDPSKSCGTKWNFIKRPSLNFTSLTWLYLTWLFFMPWMCLSLNLTFCREN